MLVPHIMTECRKSGGCLIQVFSKYEIKYARRNSRYLQTLQPLALEQRL